MSKESKKIMLPDYDAKKFVGREDEIKRVYVIFMELLQGYKPKERVITFIGEVGTGKTWLINHIATLIKQNNAQAILIDLIKYKNDSPEDAIIKILQEFYTKLTDGKTIKGNNIVEVSRFVMESAQGHARTGVIGLLLDHVYESNWDLLTYVDQYILSPFAATPYTLIVMAGRGRPYPWKTPEVPFQNFLELKPFNEKLTQKQVKKQVTTLEIERKKVFLYSGGIPMQNYLVAKFGFPKGLELSLDFIFQPVDQEDRSVVQKYLQALCVLQSFDEQKIAWMWKYYSGLDLSHIQARDIREKIVRYGFAKWNTKHNAYVLDASVYLTVNNLLYHTDSQLWNKLQSAGMSYVENLKKRYENYPFSLIKDAAEHHIGEAYFSISSTVELIGRLKEMAQIEKMICDSSCSYIAYIPGPGGVGKTRLLKELIKYLDKEKGQKPEFKNILVASRLIDLYHTKNRTDIGLAQEIVDVLGQDSFPTFRYEYDNYLKSYVHGHPVPRGKVFDAFMTDLNQIAEKQRIVIFLDTAEQLLHKDPAAVKMGLEDQYLVGQGRIFNELLPNLPNSVIVIAGRTAEPDAKSSFKRALEKKQFMVIPLRGLSLEEADQYFNQVVENATEGKLIALAASVERVSHEQRKNIFNTLCKADPNNQDNETKDKMGVRPLWLSLVVDYLVANGELLDLTTMNIPDDLIRSVFIVDRPGREWLPIIGLTVKGITSDILNTIEGRVQSDWEFLHALLNSDALQKLSFVKVRHEGETTYIAFHDEVSKWVQDNYKSLLSYVKIPEKDIYEIIRKYYKEQIEILEADLKSYGISDANEYSDELERDSKAEKLREFRLDYFSYQLIFTSSAEDVFEKYFIAAEDAFAAADRPLENLLTIELQSYVGSAPKKFDVQIGGHSFADVNAADAAVRWVKRSILSGRDEIAKKTLKEIEPLMRDGDSLASWELKIWGALLDTYMGEKPDEIFDSAIKSLLATSSSLREKAILARALNNFGYLDRRRGQLKSAVSKYEKALTLYRDTKIIFQEAYTRNNLAFALAELGRLDTAWLMVKDAYEIRCTGQQDPLGLSLNTMAHVLIRDDQAEKAVQYARRALQIFGVTGFLRGEGLAHIVFAEAKRRTTENPVGTVDVEKALQTATAHGKEAIEIFSSKFPDPIALIEAWIETGCDYRDLAKFQRVHATREIVLQSANLSDSFLMKAEELSKKRDLPYHQIDAMVNRAWLKYYVAFSLEDKEESIAILDQVENTVDERYILSSDGKLSGLLGDEKIYSPILSQLGKAEVLRGHLSLLFFKELSEQGKINALENATLHYARSLCYNQHYSDQVFRLLRRAKARIYEQFKELNTSELRIVIDGAKNYACGTSQEKLLLQLLKEYALIGE